VIYLARVTVGGVVYTDDVASLSVERAGPVASASFRCLDPWAPVDVGEVVKIELGRRLPEGDRYIAVARGTIVGTNRASRRAEESFRVTLDATDGRLKRSHPAPIRYQQKLVSEILYDVYVTRLGFAEVHHPSLPEWRVGSFEISPGQSLHQAVTGLLSGLSPRTYFPPTEDGENSRVLIFDSLRPVPVGFPATVIPLADTLSLSREAEGEDPINQVLVTVYTSTAYATESELEGLPHEDVTHELSRAEGPAGQLESLTRARVREYFDPADRERILDSWPLGETKEDYDGSGNINTRTETAITYLPGSFQRLEYKVETKKWVAVRLPGGALSLQKAAFTVAHHVYAEDLEAALAGRHELTETAVYEYTEGEVLLPERVPLAEASRERVTDQASARHDSDWMPIEHSHEAIVETPNKVRRIKTVWDDITGGVITQGETTHKGDATHEITPRTRTFLMRDETSEYSIKEPPDGIGPRPVVSWDGTPYGEALARELVETHVFGGRVRKPKRATLEPTVPDPTRLEGELYQVESRQGFLGYWRCDSVAHTYDRAAREATTTLGLTKTRERPA
jgi:hypothetical protein